MKILIILIVALGFWLISAARCKYVENIENFKYEQRKEMYRNMRRANRKENSYDA
jgi:hypothetical protein